MKKIELFEFAQCITALKQYRFVTNKYIDGIERLNIRNSEQISQLRVAASHNSDILENIAEIAPNAFGNEFLYDIPILDTEFDYTDLHQISSALKSAARDWTIFGENERIETYGPIIDSLKKYIDLNSTILIPGSGLCRLPVEIASLGYNVKTSENSFIMLLFSLLSFSTKSTFQIFPFLHSISGIDSFNDIIQSATFPTLNKCLNCSLKNNNEFCTCINIEQLIQSNHLELGAGKFESLSKTSKNSFDCIITCYFIDAVKDINQTILLIYDLLKDGGIWINFGPLVLHYSNEDIFTPYTFEDINSISNKIGFHLCEESRVLTSYAENPKNHIKTKYNCRLSINRK